MRERTSGSHTRGRFLCSLHPLSSWLPSFAAFSRLTRLSSARRSLRLRFLPPLPLLPLDTTVALLGLPSADRGESRDWAVVEDGEGVEEADAAEDGECTCRWELDCGAGSDWMEGAGDETEEESEEAEGKEAAVFAPSPSRTAPAMEARSLCGRGRVGVRGSERMEERLDVGRRLARYLRLTTDRPARRATERMAPVAESAAAAATAWYVERSWRQETTTHWQVRL